MQSSSKITDDSTLVSLDDESEARRFEERVKSSEESSSPIDYLTPEDVRTENMIDMTGWGNPFHGIKS